jgi:hypothetical protein
MPEVAVRRFRLASPRTAMVLGVLVLVLSAATLTLKGFDHQLTTSGTLSGVAIVLMYAGVGLVVARRQPRNPIGWLLLIFIVLYVLGAGATEYAVLAYSLGHRGLPLAPVAVVLDTLQAPALALFPPVILLFPDGRLTSRRWRRVLWVYAALIAYVTAVTVAPAIAAVAGHDIRLGTHGNLTNAGQLGGWLANPPAWLVVPVLVSIVLIGLSFVARQVLSWRRAGGERRQQLKWLAAGAAIAVFSILLAALLGLPVLLVGLAALPVGIGVGILKYRLYDIDRIISRTLAYAIVTGLLIGVYAGLVLLATQVFGFHAPVAVAAATLAAAALFNPLRRRVQLVVDRRFNRTRYDADRTVAAFATRLKDAVDLDSVRDDLASVVTKTLEPAHVWVWINAAEAGVDRPAATVTPR